jgi:endonuclease YncB( thermonuclease family)
MHRLSPAVAFVLTMALTAVSAMRHQSSAEDMLIGKVRVESGDTMKLGRQIVRLAGIDAPGPQDSCRIYDVTWPCGRNAKIALLQMIAGREVACTPEGKAGKAGVVIATCQLDDQDIGEQMVRSGHARARGRYGNAQVEAQRNSRGIWGGLNPSGQK